jgi:hypothetical protein
VAEFFDYICFKIGFTHYKRYFGDDAVPIGKGIANPLEKGEDEKERVG